MKIETYPNAELSSGKAKVQSIFEDGLVTVKNHDQISKDGYVINHETVDYGREMTEYISIYEVRDGLITTVRFVRD